MKDPAPYFFLFIALNLLRYIQSFLAPLQKEMLPWMREEPDYSLLDIAGLAP